MEPWDGPASIAFTDGIRIGAVLDRNGLRPSRYYVTKDDLVVMASEVGVLDIPPENVLHKGRLQPGRMFLVDTDAGPDHRRRRDQARDRRRSSPTAQWLDGQHGRARTTCPSRRRSIAPDHETVLQPAAGVRLHHRGPARSWWRRWPTTATRPIGSMGNDTPLAVLSDRPQLLYNYFKQLFAQVTNPPVDASAKRSSCRSTRPSAPRATCSSRRRESAARSSCTSPILTQRGAGEAAQPRRHAGSHGFKSDHAADAVPGQGRAATGLEAAMDDAARGGQQGDRRRLQHPHPVRPRRSTREHAPIPALLAVAAVHHHLIREGTRTQVGLVLETGEPREVHHFALLLGYGAGAINPYLAFETLDDMIRQGMLTGVDARQGRSRTTSRRSTRASSR